MLNGLHKIQNCARGVIKLYKDHRVVISWHVYVVRVFVICAVNLGNQITKITLNAIYIKNVMMIK